MKSYLALLLLFVTCLARGASPVYGNFNPTDFSLTGETLGVNNSIARLDSPVFAGNATAEGFRMLNGACEPLNLGTIAGAGTAALSAIYNCYTLTNTGASYSITMPTNMPNGDVLIYGTCTYALGPSTVTLPNAAIRPETGDQIATSTFLIAANTLSEYKALLTIRDSAVKTFSVIGDTFTPTIPANTVTFSPSGGLVATNVQAGLVELDNEKVSLADLATVASTGAYGDLSGTPAPSTLVAVYASGTAYTLTATAAALDFGTTDPALTISAAGNYRITASYIVNYVGATTTNQFVTMKLRRTNNTAADIANSSQDFTLGTFASTTFTAFTSTGREVGYTTANANDSITIFGNINVLPTAGSIQVVGAAITVERIESWTTFDASAPTVTSASIDSAGTTITINTSEAVQFGAGGNGGFAITPSGSAATLSYASGAGSSALAYTISRAIVTNETATLAYTQPGNGVEDLSGNDLVSFSGTNVTNNSSVPAFTPFTAGGNGGDYMTTGVPSAFSDAKTYTFSAWIKFDGGDGVRQDLFRNSSGRFQLNRTTTNTFNLTGSTIGGTPTLNAATSVTKIAADGWFHLYICIDMANSSNRHIYFDGVEDASVTWATYNNNAIDGLGSFVRFLAGDTGSNSMNASVCEWWLDDTYLDSPSSFRSAGNKPIDLGSNGQTPSGTAPAFYYSLTGSGSSWVNDSSGNGNNATMTGTLLSPSPP